MSGHIDNYKRRYGIVLDKEKLFDSYSLIQWYRWTIIDKTPNGKILTQIPSILITPENVGKIARYVIEDLLGFKTKEEILSIRQKHLSKYRISFSKTKFVLNSPINIIKLAYPELELHDWDFHYVGLNKWKDYSFFLEAVKYYYNDILNDFERKELDISFSTTYIEDKFCKLERAKEIYYSNKHWREILSNANIPNNFSYQNKTTYDGKYLNSKEEVMIYNFIHRELGLNQLQFIGSSRNGKYVFEYEEGNTKTKFIPDFVIERKGKKPIIIEYFGLYDERPHNYILEKYKNKTILKNMYFSNLDNIEYISLYPDDLKYNFSGIIEKFKNVG